ncbi:hypothetical protein BKA70DRAFT_1250303 [Coprinopsis sp. MPI-PUGE-AT-0042]|nr:hypothetical protein BKA70DRAFT_1250303 [Coprinopsis sp. MPI-PUGE-AT-0042]
MSTSDNSEDLVIAERFKAEGNALYLKSDFVNARNKYTAAIERDPRNATLYANRAAASLGEKQYLDAAWDCYKAVRLDNSYTKAWGRLGNAALHLRSWDLAVTALEKGLESLPSDGSVMTDSQRAMKAQLEDELEKAKASKERPPEPDMPKVKDDASRWRPWERASDLIRTKNLPNTSSDFEDGLRALKAMRIIRTPEGEMTMASSGATVEMTNGIICDERVFHLDRNLFFMIKPQSGHENQVRRGWDHIQNVEVIKQEAIRRLASEGWDGLRLAFATTVRLRIWHAFILARTQAEGHEENAHEAYSQAIELLEWGRQRWDAVDREERGPVFEKTFIRGAKRLKLQHMAKVLDESDIDNANQLSYTDDDAAQLAQELITDVDADPIPTGPMWDDNPGPVLSFWRYIKGTSFGALGWYHRRKGSYRLAAEYYEKAAVEYPEDDEFHALMLRSSMECIRVRHAIPKVSELWQGSVSEHILVHDSQDIPLLETQELYNLHQGRRTIADV